jgi:hypothetical protein
MISVFVCMPYGDHESPKKRLENTTAAIEVADRLADLGFLPYCPHLSHFWHERHPHEREHWMWQSLAWATRCDCVLAIGYPSPGMQREMAVTHAAGKPVFMDVETLSTVYGPQ